MSDPSSEGVSTTETGDETHSLTGHEPKDVNRAVSSLCTPVTSEEVAKQIRAATDVLTKKLEWLDDLMKELH